MSFLDYVSRYEGGQYYVQRHRGGKFENFGKGHLTKELAVSALIDWQAMFPDCEFRVWRS